MAPNIAIFLLLFSAVTMDQCKNPEIRLTMSENTDCENSCSSSTATCSLSRSDTCGTEFASFEDCSRKVTELKCTEVRWFYQEPKNTVWIPFNGRESLMLEVKYRKLNKIALDKTTEDQFNRFESNNENRLGKEPILVLDGQYEANIIELRIDPIYWKNDSKEIRRGTWFTSDYQPLEMELSDQIEKNHLQHFRDTVENELEIKTRLVITEQYDVRWNSAFDVHLHSTEKVLFEFMRECPTRLHRGYFARATLNDKSPKISHLIFVVHGIGQKGNENGIVENAKQVSKGVLTAMEKSYPEAKVHPMFLPIEWRSSLVLDKDFLQEITLPKRRNLRISVSDNVMDVLYYKTTLHRAEIIRSVIRKLNQYYKLFKSHNPDFNGPVHIFAHSLGSVITFDILSEHFLEEKIKEEMEEGTLKEERLCFKVEYFFAVGSPLGLFLTLSGATWKNLLPEALNVKKIFNIYNPYDPIAYRLEPFFHIEYKYIRPVTLFSKYDSSGTCSYEHFPLIVDESHPEVLEIETVENRRAIYKLTQDASFLEYRTKHPCDFELQFVFASEHKMLAEKILGDGNRVPNRMDFQIRPTFTESTYLGLITTHTSYWTNGDLALFLANVMVDETHGVELGQYDS